MDKRSVNVKSIVSALLMLCTLLYAGYNLAVRWPYFRFAVDSGWNFQSSAARLDTVINGQPACSEQILDEYSGVQRLLGKTASNGFQVIRDSRGYLHHSNFFPYETYNYEQYGIRLKELADLVNVQGGQFLFLSATNKGLKDYSLKQADFPPADFSPRTDALNYSLQGLGVPYLDSRQVLMDLADGQPQRYRYKTDPRWTVECCFEVFAGAVKHIEQTFWLELDPDGFYTNIDNYSRIEYPGGFGGTFTRLAGVPFTGLDDFVLYKPEFDTDFSIKTFHYGREIKTRGSFDEVILSSGNLEADSPYGRDMFAAYFGGQAPLRVINNHLNKSGPKILLIGDDYSAPLAAFLAPIAGELHYAWPYDNPAIEDLNQYIEIHGFDLVIWESSPDNMTSSGFRILDQ